MAPWGYIALTVLSIGLLGGLITMIVLYENEKSANTRNSRIDSSNTTFAPGTSTVSHSVCPTPGCAEAANLLKSYLDETVNPCDDFYEYSCGTWVANNPIPDSQNRMDQKTVAMHLVSDLIVAKLNELVAGRNSPNFCHAAQEVLLGCVNQLNGSVTAFDWGPRVVATLNGELNLGGWPMAQSTWQEPAGWDVYASTAALMMLGTTTFLDIQVDIDWGRVESNGIYVDQAVLGLGSRRIYLESQFEQNLADYAGKIGKTALDLATEQPANLSTQVGQLVDFEVRLASMTEPDEDRFDPVRQNNRFNWTSLNARWPSIHWASVMNKLLLSNISAYQGVFIIKEPGYLDSMIQLILHTPSRVVANYLGWRYVSSLLGYKSGGFKPSGDRLSLGPQDPQVTCTILLAEQMTFALAYVYQLADPPRSAQVRDLEATVRKAVADHFQQLQWLDGPSQGNFQTKLNSTVANLLYPEWIADVARLESLFSSLSPKLMASDSFFDQLALLRHYTKATNVQMIWAPPDRHIFAVPPVEFFAVFNQPRNAFTVAAAFTNEPYWNCSWPMSMQLGGLGWLITRNILKGFNQMGIGFGATGSLMQLLSVQSRQSYNVNLQCLIEQYDTFCFPAPVNLCLNGQNTQGENLCDGAALNVAYQAYQKLNAADERLPGYSHLSNDQLLFISFALPWCRNASADAVRDWILLDTHSPAESRIRGSVINNPDFARVFRCQRGDAMYPADDKRCKIEQFL